jgi:signal transduction histidine kinase/PAS domain-containing protein/ActR/RegA family two-component response regulator
MRKNVHQPLASMQHDLAADGGFIAWEAGPDGVVRDLPAWRAFTGQSQAAVRGEGWLAALHPDEREQVRAAWRHAVATCTPFVHAARLRGADGSYRYFWARCAPMRAADGSVRQWRGTWIDGDEQQRAMMEEQARLRLAADEAHAVAASATDRLRIIQSVTDTTMAHLALRDLLHAVLRSISDALHVDSATILLLDEARQTFTRYTSYGVDEAIAEDWHIPVGSGVAGRIAATRQPVIIADLARDAVTRPSLARNLRSLAGVPLIVGDRVLGVMHVDTIQEHHFTEADLQLLQILAVRISLAVNQAYLFEAERLAHAEAVAHMRELEAIFEAMADGVAVYDQHGRILRMNAIMQQQLGVADMRDADAFSLQQRAERLMVCDPQGRSFPPGQLPLERVLRGESLTGMNAPDIELTGLDGQGHLLNISGAPIRNERKAIVGAVLILHDVAARRRLEQQTQTALDAMLEMVTTFVASKELAVDEQHPDTLVRHLAELSCHIVNCQRATLVSILAERATLRPLAAAGVTPAAEQLWRASVQGTALEDWLTADQIARLCADEAIVLTNTRRQYHIHPFASERGICLIAPMCIDTRLMGLLCVEYADKAHVFTSEEIALARGVARLAALVLEREWLTHEREEALAALRAVQQTNHMKNLFLANMSHELRTPLTGILGCAELVQRQMLGPLTAEQQEYLTDILTSARHLLRLINDILDLSKIEAGKMRFFPEIIQPSHVVKEVCDIVRPMAAGKDITLTNRIDPALAQVMLDPAKFKQILYNFLSNGIKFTPDGGCVTVRLLPEEGERFRVEVEDTGIGIAANEIAQLFQPFQQLDASASKRFAGTGLGLALTKQIVEAQGGTVGVVSEPGVGSRFWAVLPCWNAPARAGSEAQAQDDRQAIRADRRLILIIEDDAPERDWMTHMLAEAGYIVHTAVTGAQALVLCHTRVYAAILLDLFLPDMNGWQILQDLRTQGPNQATCVIVITIAAEHDLVMAHPVQAVLTKPVQRGDLLATIQRLIALSTAKQAASQAKGVSDGNQVDYGGGG